MFTYQKSGISALVVPAILAIVIAAPAFAVTALDIETIYVSSIKDHYDGVAEAAPWVFEVWIDIQDMANLEHIDITKPGDSGPSIILDSTDYWEYMSPSGYSSLENLQKVVLDHFK